MTPGARSVVPAPHCAHSTTLVLLGVTYLRGVGFGLVCAYGKGVAETEPSYEYVKGKGWVISTTPTIVVERNNKRVTAFLRAPVVGERFFYNVTTRGRHYDDDWYRQFRDEDNNFLFEKFVNFFVDRDLSYREDIGVRYCGQDYPKDSVTVVFYTEVLT